MIWTIGVDVGGTFTDFCAIAEETGDVRLWKRPSTPENPAVAILDGLQELAVAHDIPLADVRRLSHGTTVATNTLIQRKGRAVALITTRGFRDLVEIGRQTRPHVYDLQRDQPDPLVPRDRRLEVSERIDASGAVHKALDLRDVDAAIAAIAGMQVEAVAVCFLFAFLNAAHERAVADRLRQALPGIHVSLSSAVQPEFREYERFNTTILNAYLQPVVAEYFQVLEESLLRLLPKAAVGINQSSGGLMTVTRAKAFPVRTALSGPAAGVMGALHVALAAGRPNAITIDVGGTSADVAVIHNGRVEVSNGRDVDGFPVRLPMIDIQTIGAGGGSIAWFERDGMLKMGPNSAGARPGPACYGHGGTQPTLSDANLVLGRLSPTLISGAMKLDVDLARRAIEPIARVIGKSIESTARGMVAISVANMVRAIRVMSVERGHDPRDYVLVPFGGAGPLHAHDIAEALSIKEIIVPRAPGIVCAQGLVIADLKEDFVIGMRAPMGDTVPQSTLDAVRELGGRAIAWAAYESITAESVVCELSFDMRYVGQNFELSVPVASGAVLRPEALPAANEIKTAFFKAHELAYGFHDPSAVVEVMQVRITARSPLFRAADESLPALAGAKPLPCDERRVYFDLDQATITPVYRREQLPLAAELDGPAIIEQMDTTIPLFPRERLRVHASGNLIIKARS